MGYGNTASSFVETALGTQGTIVAGDPLNFVGTDRLLNVGNGSSGRSDAFTILKNGNTGIGNSTPAEKLVVNNGNVAIANTNNTAGTLKFAEPSTSGTNTTTFKAGVQTADINYTLPLTAPTASQVLSSDASGNMSWATPAGSALQYFAESQNNVVPNATVPVHKFAAIGTETNIDIALSPKGNGAITAQVADGTVTGGNKRGQYAVDLQMGRFINAAAVASGQYSAIPGGYSNTASGICSTAIGAYTIASGNYSTAISNGVLASGDYSFAAGEITTASGQGSTSFGKNTLASGVYSIAMGRLMTANSYGETALGIFGTTGAGSATSIVATDRLLNVGNGNFGAGNSSDAFTILKNGNTGLSDSTPTSTLDVNGTFATATFVGSTATSVTGAYSIYVYTTVSGGAVTFPAASSCTNRRYRIVNKTSFNITVSSYKNLINFPITALAAGKYIEIVSDGTDWQQIGGN